MFGFPGSTEFNKRIPKQKFYENIDISPALKRIFVEQIRLVHWRNKLAATTLNIAAGDSVTEIEVFEIRLYAQQLDEAVLRQIDKEIPYHILFILTCDGNAQAWIGYKEAAGSGSNAFKGRPKAVLLATKYDDFNPRPCVRGDREAHIAEMQAQDISIHAPA